MPQDPQSQVERFRVASIHQGTPIAVTVKSKSDLNTPPDGNEKWRSAGGGDSIGKDGVTGVLLPLALKYWLDSGQHASADKHGRGDDPPKQFDGLYGGSDPDQVKDAAANAYSYSPYGAIEPPWEELGRKRRAHPERIESWKSQSKSIVILSIELEGEPAHTDHFVSRLPDCKAVPPHWHETWVYQWVYRVTRVRIRYKVRLGRVWSKVLLHESYEGEDIVLESTQYVYFRPMTAQQVEIVCERKRRRTGGGTATAPSEPVPADDPELGSYLVPPTPPPAPPEGDRKDPSGTGPWTFEQIRLVRVPSGTYSAWPSAGWNWTGPSVAPIELPATVPDALRSEIDTMESIQAPRLPTTIRSVRLIDASLDDDGLDIEFADAEDADPEPAARPARDRIGWLRDRRT